MKIKSILADLEKKHPGEVEFLQAVREVLDSIEEVYNEIPSLPKPAYCKDSLNLTAY